ncbi:MAG: DUF1800 domain-containing protein, partial [Chloroflexi bacterium]|nr:DUF1800 domain-containing protein [Chloroflexota bacterium]
MSSSPRLSRRGFIGSLLGAAAISSCSRLIDELAHEGLPDSLSPPGGDTRHPIAHLLNRATYGPRPGQIEEVERMGRDRWLEEQLDFRSIDDTRCDWRLRRYDTLKMRPADVMSFDRNRSYVAYELARATLVRAVFSRRELFEVMVGFWSDHFSIYQYKGQVAFLKTIDDREVIRRHAMGKFRDLLSASAHSPAMLHYLDNTVNEKSHPNENYAREIMELHTLGVDGGYTEHDIQEVARCFTGWTMTNSGEFQFREDWHDDGKKMVLGHEIPAGGGKRDGEQVIDILAQHPSTPTFVCTKLVRRFIADDPPPEYVDACVQTWQDTNGDIRLILRTLFNHPEFDNAPPKYKRPFTLLTSILRATNAQYTGDEELINRLDVMGHRPFFWQTPDGYPDTADIWANSRFQYWKLEIAAVHDRLPGVDIDLWAIADHVDVDRDAGKMLRFFGRLLLKRDLSSEEISVLETFAQGEEKRTLDPVSYTHL